MCFPPVMTNSWTKAESITKSGKDSSKHFHKSETHACTQTHSYTRMCKTHLREFYLYLSGFCWCSRSYWSKRKTWTTGMLEYVCLCSFNKGFYSFYRESQVYTAYHNEIWTLFLLAYKLKPVW